VSGVRATYQGLPKDDREVALMMRRILLVLAAAALMAAMVMGEQVRR
jgi:hypothetical protein